MKYADFLGRTAFSKEELIALSQGNLVDDPPGELVRLERQGAVTVPDRDRAVCGMLVTAGVGAQRMRGCRHVLALGSLLRMLFCGLRSLVAIRLHPAGPVDRLPPE